jgi:outer membrane protein OmpA-like peptidoglycan-associated protein/tetratricopeptide (TPR) repeat protein
MKNLILILLLPAMCQGQGLKQADKDYAMLNYSDAISGYEKHISKLKTKSTETDVLVNLANSCFYAKDYSKARKYYSQLYSQQGDGMNEELFARMISTLRIAGDYDRANDLVKSYYAKNAQRTKLMTYQKNKLDSLQPEYNNVVNLAINSAQSDFGVTLYGKEAVFSSSRPITDGQATPAGEIAYLNLYGSVRNPNNGQLSNAKGFLNNLNSGYHDATLVFSKDLSIVFFSRNFLTKKDKLDAPNGEVSNVMIMKANIKDNQLIDITPLDFNSKKYNCSQPFVSSDGKWLFFASDMPGGFGQSDIYVAELYNDGSTGEPVNLGAMINTPGIEMFPSISGDSLFFSSDFHYGYGGLDVFYAKMTGKTNFSIPENVGKPINSNMDDFAFLRLDDRTGYFSSDRKGGKGEDDIYWFDMVALKQFIEYSGLVLTKGDDAPVPNAKVQVYDLFNELILETQSDDKGNYDALLPCNTQLKFVYSKPEYSTETVSVSTPEKAGESKDNDVRLTSFSSLVEKDGNMEKIKVDPIYFEYNKWDITSQAETELNKILFAMEKFPNVKIKIESHTDARGSDSYNLKLSDNRAKSTMDYLISKGVDASRIESATGYGETRPKNKCKNGVKCSEEEYFMNRRSDFIVISK